MTDFSIFAWEINDHSITHWFKQYYIVIVIAHTSKFYKQCKYRIWQQDYESYIKSYPSQIYLN